MQVLYSLIGPRSSVAWFAHIGGFIFGLAMLKLFEKKKGRRTRYKVY
jgi:membrane associated rhomboid family serine protease